MSCGHKHKKQRTSYEVLCFLEATTRFELVIRVLQTHALPLGYVAVLKNGADDEARTRYLHLGKVALYQMSYIRIKNE